MLGLFACGEQAFAGAWTLPKGEGLAIATAQASRASDGFGAERKSGAIPTFRKAEIQILAEYGVSDRFTLRGRTEARDVRQDGAERETGLGFSEIGARVRLLAKDALLVSAEGNVRLAQVPEIVDPTLQGVLEAEYEARLLAGYGFTLANRQAFLNGEAAYRARGGERPDEIRVDATFGYRPIPKLLVLTQTFSTISLGEDVSGNEGYDYHKLQLSAVRDLTARTAVQLGGFSTVAGRNALQENGLLTALWVRF